MAHTRPRHVTVLMPYDPAIHQRRSLRLEHHDYARGGAYFVTICSYRRSPLFGVVARGRVRRNAYGDIVLSEWERSAVMRPDLELGEAVVMPDHLHALLRLHGPGGGWDAHRAGPAPASLGAIIAGFKASATARINRLRGTPDARVWQRNYHERIVRNEAHYRRIEAYIRANPSKWDARVRGAGAPRGR